MTDTTTTYIGKVIVLPTIASGTSITITNISNKPVLITEVTA